MRPQFLQQSTFESLDLKVKASQCKHRILSVAHIGNRLLARLAPLCIFPVCALEVFGELAIRSCEMLIDAPLFAPIACLRPMDPRSSSLVGFGAPVWYTNVSLVSWMDSIHAKIAAQSRDCNPCLKHWIAPSSVCNFDKHSSTRDVIGFVSSTGSTSVSISVSVKWSLRIWLAWSIKGNDPHRCGMCLSIIILMPSICLHLLAGSWQSQYEHWSDTLYHTSGFVKLNILNQYRGSSTICIVALLVSYLSTIPLTHLSLVVWSVRFTWGANLLLPHISCRFLYHQ